MQLFAVTFAALCPPLEYSRWTMFGCSMNSSRASSMVTSRSSCGMWPTSDFMKVVLPLPVAPATTMFFLYATDFLKNSA